MHTKIAALACLASFSLASPAHAQPCVRAHDYLIMQEPRRALVDMMESADFSQKYGVAVAHHLVPDAPASLTVVNGSIIAALLSENRERSSKGDDVVEVLDTGKSLYGASNGLSYEIRAMQNDFVDLIVSGSEKRFRVITPSSGGWIAVVNDTAIAGFAVDNACDE